MLRVYRNKFNSNATTGRAIWARDQGRCIYCGSPASVIDHVIPEKFKGRALYENGVCACQSCNTYKGKHPEDLTFVEQAYQHLHQCGIVFQNEKLPVSISVKEHIKYLIKKTPSTIATICERCQQPFEYKVKNKLTPSHHVRKYCDKCRRLDPGNHIRSGDKLLLGSVK